jgi:hypothetical protein
MRRGSDTDQADTRVSVLRLSACCVSPLGLQAGAGYEKVGWRRGRRRREHLAPGLEVGERDGFPIGICLKLNGG